MEASLEDQVATMRTMLAAAELAMVNIVTVLERKGVVTRQEVATSFANTATGLSETESHFEPLAAAMRALAESMMLSDGSTPAALSGLDRPH